MTLAGIWTSWEGVDGRAPAGGESSFLDKVDTALPSVPVKFLIADISCPYAQREPAQGPARGRVWRFAIRGRGGPLLHPVGGLPADRNARGGSGHRALGAPSPRRQPDRGGSDPEIG